MEAKKYIVMVDDNFHYRDEDERYQAGAYDTLEEAIRKCKEVVENSIQYKEGMSGDELIAQYCMFGEDPYIIGDASFSGREYARKYCKKLCKE